MVAKAVAQLRAARVAPADAQRVLTVASLVEAEAQREADRGKVARVIYNRLATEDEAADRRHRQLRRAAPWQRGHE